MGNMLQAKVTIEGTRPLWWHAFTPDAMSGDKKEREGTAGNDPSEWKRTVLRGEDGRLYVEGTYVFGCLRDGAKYTKKGRGSIQSLVAATLQITDSRVYSDRYFPDGDLPTNPDEPVYLDVRGVKNPATKARNVRYRVAASPGWHLTFNLLWDKVIVNRAQMESVCTDAGMLVGIADGRSIGMGRFVVTDFSVTEQ